jgi:hypothetical protein
MAQPAKMLSYVSHETNGIYNPYRFRLEFQTGDVDGIPIGSIAFRTGEVAKRIFICTANVSDLRKTSLVRTLSFLKPEDVEKLVAKLSEPRKGYNYAGLLVPVLWHLDDVEEFVCESSKQSDDAAFRAYWFNFRVNSELDNYWMRDPVSPSGKMKIHWDKERAIRIDLAPKFNVNAQAPGELLPIPIEKDIEKGLQDPDPMVRAFFLTKKITKEVEIRVRFLPENTSRREWFTTYDQVKAELEAKYHVPSDPLSLRVPSFRKEMQVNKASLDQLNKDKFLLEEGRIAYNRFIVDEGVVSV